LSSTAYSQILKSLELFKSNLSALIGDELSDVRVGIDIEDIQASIHLGIFMFYSISERNESLNDCHREAKNLYFRDLLMNYYPRFAFGTVSLQFVMPSSIVSERADPKEAFSMVFSIFTDYDESCFEERIRCLHSPPLRSK
jgi:hypothetical protein